MGRSLCTLADGDEQNNRIVVFGGGGYVGGAICKAALAKGMKVTSINRSGPSSDAESWVSDVEWVKGDVFEPVEWEDKLKGAVGVVSSIGAFGSAEFMERVCGDANIA